MLWIGITRPLAVVEEMEEGCDIYCHAESYQDGPDEQPVLTAAARNKIKGALWQMADVCAKFDAPEISRFLKSHSEDDEVPNSAEVYATLCKAFWDGVHEKSVFFLNRDQMEHYKNSFGSFGEGVTRAFSSAHSKRDRAGQQMPGV